MCLVRERFLQKKVDYTLISLSSNAILPLDKLHMFI